MKKSIMSLAAKFFLIAFTVLLLSSCKIEREENKNPNLSLADGNMKANIIMEILLRIFLGNTLL